MFSINLVAAILFAKSRPEGLESNFYGIIAIIEFLNLFFIRTRSALKYFPKSIFMI